MKKLDALALGYAGAAVSAACMLLLSILANMGLYTDAAAQMMQWHMYYSLSFGGIIGGMIEAAVIAFILLYALGFAYNWFLSKT